MSAEPNNPTTNTSSAPASTTVSTTPTPSYHKLKVDDREELVTTEELVRRAQKNGAADAALERAKNLEREHSKYIELGKALVAADKGEAEALERVGHLLGFSEEQIRGLSAQPPSQSASAPQPAPVQQGPVSFDNLPPAVRKFFSTMIEQGVDPQEYVQRTTKGLVSNAQNEMMNDLKGALDKDESLRYYLKDKDQSEFITRYVVDVMRRRCQEGRGSVSYGPDLLAAAVQETRASMQQAGIQPKVQPRSTFGVTALGVPSGGGSTNIHQPTPPTRPNLHSGDDDQLVDYYLHKLRSYDENQS